MGDGGQRESDDRRCPSGLTEGHDETADGLRCWTRWRTAPWEGRTHRTTDPWRPQPSVKDVAFGIEMGEVIDVEWRLRLADVNDHDLTVWIATTDHDPAGVQEPVDAFGGETVDALTHGHRDG
jgi:hypothetical protein